MEKMGKIRGEERTMWKKGEEKEGGEKDGDD